MGNILTTEIEPPGMTVVTTGSREARTMLTPSTQVSRAHSPTPDILKEQTTTSLIPGTTIPGFGELVTNSQGDMAEERPRVATLVAVMIAEGPDTEEQSHHGGLLVYDMKRSNQSPHMSPPLIGRVSLSH